MTPLSKAGAVDYFARRFLRTPLSPADGQGLLKFLNQRLGNGALDFNRQSLESDLREMLHLTLSLPAYQLA